MITAEEAKNQSEKAIEKQKQDNIKFVIEDIDKEIQKAVKKGYSGIYYDITKLIDTMKVREYLLSYGYQCRIVNDMGMLGFDINWKNPEAARKEYNELIRVKAKFDQPLFKFDEIEEVKPYGA
jgi:hypothetical protein